MRIQIRYGEPKEPHPDGALGSKGADEKPVDPTPRTAGLDGIWTSMNGHPLYCPHCGGMSDSVEHGPPDDAPCCVDCGAAGLCHCRRCSHWSRRDPHILPPMAGECACGRGPHDGSHRRGSDGRQKCALCWAAHDNLDTHCRCGHPADPSRGRFKDGSPQCRECGDFWDGFTTVLVRAAIERYKADRVARGLTPLPVKPAPAVAAAQPDREAIAAKRRSRAARSIGALLAGADQIIEQRRGNQ